jgi:hypothetical protein
LDEQNQEQQINNTEVNKETIISSNLEETIIHLRDYVSYSRQVRNAEGFRYIDFNEVCEQHCIDIETILNEIEKGNNNGEV